MSRIGTLLVLAALAVAGCGGSTDDTGESTTTDAEADVSADASTAQAEPESSAGAVEAGALVDVEGIATIVVLTPSTGNGDFPLLEWRPVEDVERYAVTLTASDGQSYWAWSGSTNQVYLGGLRESPAPESSGPYLFEPMTVLVVGIDGGGDVVAASEATIIAP